MPDRVMHRIDDRLSVRSDIVDASVEVEDPIQRLLRRSDVVGLRAEDNNWGANITKIDARAVRGPDRRRGELVADEQFIGDELHFASVEQHMTAPPLLKFQIPWGFRIDFE